MIKVTGITCRILVYMLCVVGFASTDVMAGKKQDGSVGRSYLLRLAKTNSCPGCDLSGQDLTRMNLKGADLHGADLRNARLHLVNLAGADLRDALLAGAVMVGADLAGADLRGAELGERSLDGAYVVGALFDNEETEFASVTREGDKQEAVAEPKSDKDLIVVRSEENVSMVKLPMEDPLPKKVRPMSTATLSEIPGDAKSEVK